MRPVSYTHLDVYKRQEEEMKAHGVPDWYIWSCKKIKYMFPKAHAAAYVMMAYRIAYCKIFYPQAYYAAFFSIRAPGFDYELMCLGQDKLLYHMKDYEKRMDTLSKKEQDTYRDMKVVREMYARGFEFLPIDIYESGANRFKIKAVSYTHLDVYKRQSRKCSTYTRRSDRKKAFDERSISDGIDRF